MQIDHNWHLIRSGDVGVPGSWIDWFAVCLINYHHFSSALTSLPVAQDIAHNARIGMDGRMISYEKAVSLSHRVNIQGCKMVFPVQNLIDIVWGRDKPHKSLEPVFEQPVKYAGESADSKLQRVREWISAQPPDIPSYMKLSEAKDSQKLVGMIVSALPAIGMRYSC
jgi:Xaa-Pro aminopeptidase